MTRVIRMDRQVVDLPGYRQFSLWDTIRDRFLKVNGNQSWECVDQLAKDFADDIASVGDAPDAPHLVATRDRCLSLVRSILEYALPPSDVDE